MCKRLATVAMICLSLVVPCQACAQQDSIPASPRAEIQPAKPKPPHFGGTHRFWDAENRWLFAGVGASRALDYSSTLNMRSRGRQEILLNNQTVDNRALFAGIEVAGTAASIGASYLFHRAGHHRLERLTSAIHLSLTAVGAARNYSLKTAHPAAAMR